MNKVTVVLICMVGFLLSGFKDHNKIKVLILSGRNNHDWETTTPKLKSIYENSGLFQVEVTENPELLTEADFKKFDAVVSNWNSFPEKDVRWSSESENALLNFVKSGGGFVTFHASTTAFYEWPEFKEISTGAWIDGTYHGKQSETEVNIQNKRHPVTKGIQDFTMKDELWINAERNPSFKILGSATNKELQEKGIKKQPAIMVKDYGKGRVFHTILGHGVKNMQNEDFQNLMVRATEWAATGKVKQ